MICPNNGQQCKYTECPMYSDIYCLLALKVKKELGALSMLEKQHITSLAKKAASKEAMRV